MLFTDSIMTENSTASAKPADAVAAALVDRAPPKVQPYFAFDAAGPADRHLAALLALRVRLILGAAAESRPFGTWHDIFWSSCLPSAPSSCAARLHL